MATVWPLRARHMYTVQSRINGHLVDEERCVTFGEALDALERRRRVLMAAGAAPVVGDPWQHVLARVAEGWVTVTIADGEPH